MLLNQNINKEDERNLEAEVNILAVQHKFDKAQANFLALAALINGKVIEFSNHEE